MKRTDRLRTIGVLAHVDAGKTTLTERMLFAAGRIHKMGEVHDGAAAMDTRAAERRHGVTVSAAATAVAWRDHQISVLDTPGHVDFTHEVERALLAIDAAVVVFSGVAGVEPQTRTVWSQADRFGLPRIGFVNKMDALGADFDQVVAAVRETLGAPAAAIQRPIVEDGALIGALDLIEGDWLTRPDAETMRAPDALKPRRAEIPAHLRDLAAAGRAALVEAAVDAAGADADISDWLADRAFAPDRLRGLVRRGALAGRLTPMLGGAAYRGVGVASLLDAVVDLGPSPLDRGAVLGRDPRDDAETTRAPDPEAPVSALVSKVSVTRFGPVATLRVLSGTLTRDQRLTNPRAGVVERIGRVLALHADETVEIDAAGPGDVVAATGLKSARSGDSLSDPTAPIVFAGLAAVEPVVEAAIEAASAADQVKLGPALAALTREDPSLRVATDPETGELLLAGMGELHLQIALEALADERGVAARIGRPRIAYREAITEPAEVVHTLKKQSGGPGQFAKLALRLQPPAPGETGLRFENRSVGGSVPSEYLPAIEQALAAALSEGGLAGYPVEGLRAIVLDGAHHATDSSSLAFANAATAAFREAYRAARPVLLEPIARIEATAPEAHVGAIVADVQARRGAVLAVEPGRAAHRVTAEAPLANLWGYAGAVRSLTRGLGAASLAPARYAPAPSETLAALTRARA